MSVPLKYQTITIVIIMTLFDWDEYDITLFFFFFFRFSYLSLSYHKLCWALTLPQLTFRGVLIAGFISYCYYYCLIWLRYVRPI